MRVEMEVRARREDLQAGLGRHAQLRGGVLVVPVDCVEKEAASGFHQDMSVAEAKMAWAMTECSAESEVGLPFVGLAERRQAARLSC